MRATAYRAVFYQGQPLPESARVEKRWRSRSMDDCRVLRRKADGGWGVDDEALKIIKGESQPSFFLSRIPAGEEVEIARNILVCDGWGILWGAGSRTHCSPQLARNAAEQQAHLQTHTQFPPRTGMPGQHSTLRSNAYHPPLCHRRGMRLPQPQYYATSDFESAPLADLFRGFSSLRQSQSPLNWSSMLLYLCLWRGIQDCGPCTAAQGARHPD